tara:strand:+ start:990 stop:1613 length:624 start_codon:yes stop_codon:yes gene_type:complete
MTTEQRIKNQYSKVFSLDDYIPFKQAADYYFNFAATIKKRDIPASDNLKLWFRNIQKRLYIGIGTELLLKALYLKNNYNINRPKQNKKDLKIKFPEKIPNLNSLDLNPNDTYTLSQLINKLDVVIPKRSEYDEIIDGLNICKVFRNKEGHIAVHYHDFIKDDFRKIEYSIKKIYQTGFNENLEFKISFSKTDKTGKFKKTHYNNGYK